MIKNTIILSLALVSLVSTVYATEPLQNSEQTVTYFNQELNFRITPHDLKQKLAAEKRDFVVVDVRDEKSYKEGHIPGAINVPQDKHHHFEGAETSFPGLRKDVYNYVYCYTPTCNLAQVAARKFASLGYPVKEIVGGYDGWQAEGNPIER